MSVSQLNTAMKKIVSGDVADKAEMKTLVDLAFTWDGGNEA